MSFPIQIPKYPQHSEMLPPQGVQKWYTKYSAWLPLQSDCSSSVHKRASGNGAEIHSIPLKLVNTRTGQTPWDPIHMQNVVSFWQQAAAAVFKPHLQGALLGVLWCLSDIWSSINSFLIVEVNLEALVHTLRKQLPAFSPWLSLCWPDVPVGWCWSSALSSLDSSPKHSSLQDLLLSAPGGEYQPG